MAKMNRAIAQKITTYNGAPAKKISPEQQLRRSVMSCLLWEKEFYEDGKQISKRIKDLVAIVRPDIVADIAIEAKTRFNLRHVPLLLISFMAEVPECKQYIRQVIREVIRRPDEMGELLALYYNGTDRGKPLANSIRRGIADVFGKFNEYQLAKYNRPGGITLRDVLFLTHPKPANENQDILWKKLIGGFCQNCGRSHYDKDTFKVLPVIEGCNNYVESKLAIPDTWETQITNKNRKETWTRLLEEKHLGALALLRNLRNMVTDGVSDKLISNSLVEMKVDKIFPYRFIAAAKIVPRFIMPLEKAMFKNLSMVNKLPGKTKLLVDVSGSMDRRLSDKSDLMRIDAANGLAMMLREVCEDLTIYTFSTGVKQISSDVRGFTLADSILRSQPHRSTYLCKAIKHAYSDGVPDRLIVITDEQSDDPVPDPTGVGFMINVASARNGVGYGKWYHIDGFSEAVVTWIQEVVAEI